MTTVCIAIDGPVASGKSSIGKHLAAALGYLYLDTGAMYRGVTSLVLSRGLDPHDESCVTEVARHVVFSFPELAAVRAVNPPLLADGVDITATLRTPLVDQQVSVVARFGGVREALVASQRAIRAEQSVVMVGRDIGTVVVPDAEVKVYLSATVEDRARRRYEERLALGEPDSFLQTLADLKRRDQLDTERTLSPLRPAADALLLDTTGYSLEHAADFVLAAVPGKLEERCR